MQFLNNEFLSLYFFQQLDGSQNRIIKIGENCMYIILNVISFHVA